VLLCIAPEVALWGCDKCKNVRDKMIRLTAQAKAAIDPRVQRAAQGNSDGCRDVVTAFQPKSVPVIGPPKVLKSLCGPELKLPSVAVKVIAKASMWNKLTNPRTIKTSPFFPGEHTAGIYDPRYQD
jgi:hypothetical protein